MDGAFSGRGSKKKAVAVSLGGFGLLAFLFWGSGTFSAEGSPSFFADAKTAFSETFLRNETFRGEFDFRESGEMKAVRGEGIACAFETAERPSRGSVVFSEIAWMGTSEGHEEEWIELSNRSAKTEDISFWRIMDRGGDISIGFPKNAVLAPGEFLVVRRGKGTGEFSGSLRNADELIRLFDDDCALRDEAGGAKWEAGNNRTKQTMERDASGFGWHTSPFPGGSPGSENSKIKTQISNLQKNTEVDKPKTSDSVISDDAKTESAKKGAINIVEVVAGIEGNAGHEFIRLQNDSDAPADLTGWMIKKRSSTGNETTLVSSARLAGKTIPAHGDFLLAHEEGYSGAAKPDVWWPKSYTLAEKGNAVVLYDGEGTRAGEYSW